MSVEGGRERVERAEAGGVGAGQRLDCVGSRGGDVRLWVKKSTL